MFLIVVWPLVWALHALFKWLGIQATARVTNLHDLNAPDSLLQYAYFFLLFHAGVIAFIALAAWGIYNTSDFFDWFAQTMRVFVKEGTPADAGEFLQTGASGKSAPIDVPFMGESYYSQLMDILFHLLVAFSLFSLAMLIVIRRWIYLQVCWKSLDTSAATPRGSSPAAARAGAEQYRELFDLIQGSFFRVVSSRQEYRKVFDELGLEPTASSSFSASHFAITDYMSVSLGRALSELVNLELVTALLLSLFFAIIGLIAFQFKLQFRYFLEPIAGVTVLGSCSVIVLYKWVKGRLTSTDMSIKPLEVVSVKTWAKTVQIMFYMLLFSFSRLVISRDMWTNYTLQALWALVLLVLFFLLLRFVLADLMEVTAYALTLPPNIHAWRFRSLVAEVASATSRKAALASAAPSPKATPRPLPSVRESDAV